MNALTTTIEEEIGTPVEGGAEEQAQQPFHISKLIKEGKHAEAMVLCNDLLRL